MSRFFTIHIILDVISYLSEAAKLELMNHPPTFSSRLTSARHYPRATPP